MAYYDDTGRYMGNIEADDDLIVIDSKIEKANKIDEELLDRSVMIKEGIKDLIKQLDEMQKLAESHPFKDQPMIEDAIPMIAKAIVYLDDANTENEKAFWSIAGA